MEKRESGVFTTKYTKVQRRGLKRDLIILNHYMCSLFLLFVFLLPLAGEETKDKKPFIRRTTFRHEESKRDFFIVKRPAYACLKIETPPVLDGKLDDTCWKELPRLMDFYSGAGHGLTSRKSTGWICYDETHLYIAMLCLEPSPDSMRMNVNEPGGPVWNDDDIEIFLDPEGQGKGKLQYMVNPQGMPCQTLKPSAWQVKTSIGKDRWTVEAAIPFSELKNKPEGIWGFNLTRGMPGLDEFGGWAGLVGSWHQPEKFAQLAFTPPPALWATEIDLGRLTEGGNTLSMQARNMTDAPLKADLTFDIKSEDGKTQTLKQALSLKGNEKQKIQLDYVFDQPGEHKLVLTMAEAESGKVLWSETYRAKAQSLASMLVTRRCYPGSRETGAVVTLGFSDKKLLQNTTVEIDLVKDGKILRSGSLTKLEANSVSMMVDIAGLKPGTYALQARIFSGEKELGKRSGEFEIIADPFTWGGE